VGLRAGLDDVEKRKSLTLPGIELRSLTRQARSKLIYRLRYPGSLYYDCIQINTDVNSVLELLYHVVVGDVVGLPEEHAASLGL
jgi:hypothetical protein